MYVCVQITLLFSLPDKLFTFLCHHVSTMGAFCLYFNKPNTQTHLHTAHSQKNTDIDSGRYSKIDDKREEVF